MKLFRSKAKQLLPKKIWVGLIKSYFRIFGMEKEFSAISSEEIFDRIYKDGLWDVDENANTTSGSGSHIPAIVNPYVESVTSVLLENPKSVIVDLGCGDFNVSKHFVDHALKCVGCDISEVILEQNRQKFVHPNLEFTKINLSVDDLPKGDIALVRQVLQHLSNKEISSFVDYINKHKPYRKIIITESLPASKGFVPNIDKPTGADIRAWLDSGVVLHQKPFNMRYKTKKLLLEVPEEIGVLDTVVVATLYDL